MGENERKRGERRKKRETSTARDLPLFVLTEKQFPTSQRRTVNVLAGVQYCLLYIIPRSGKKESKREREREREKRRARIDVARRTACDPFPTPDAGARDEVLPHALPSGDRRR